MAIPSPQVISTVDTVSDQRLDIDGTVWQLSTNTDESVILYGITSNAGTAYEIGYLKERPAVVNFYGTMAAPAVSGELEVTTLGAIASTKFYVDYDRAFILFPDGHSTPVNVTYKGMGSIQKAKDVNEALLGNEWAKKTGAVVTGTSEYSAKEYALGTTVAVGSAKDWAVQAEDSAVTGSSYSALHHAAKADDSRLAAKASAAAVASAFDSFDDTYLGTMSDTSAQGTNPTTNGTWGINSSAITVVSGSNIKVGQVVFTGYGVYGTYNGTKDGPTTDNDNGALANGMLYFNSTDNNMMVYKETGAAWIAATSSGGVSLVMHKVTASGSETSFAAGTFTPTLTYEVNNIVVFLNGVRLDATDYTATTGTSITGLAAVAASDELVVLAFKTFEVADTVSAASGGTFSGNVTHNGNVIMATNKKVQQKGAFMQSSTHQALTLGG